MSTFASWEGGDLVLFLILKCKFEGQNWNAKTYAKVIQAHDENIYK